MSGEITAGQCVGVLLEERGICGPACDRLVELGWWGEWSHGCAATASCLLHWPADASYASYQGAFALWRRDHWVVDAWTHGSVEWLASWERVDEDVTDLAAEALLDELARGGWRVHPAEERQRRQASWREQHTHPGGRGFLIGGDTGRWLWLRDFVLVDPPSGVLATDSRGDPPSEY